jgi:2-(1,2-epoxy-1,2-dihydrophenyl)acetyl-CoA isomerase
MTTTAPLLRDTPAEGVARLTFNRPDALNGLDTPMARAFREAVESLRGDASVRAVVLRGAGRAFCAGGDLRQLASQPDGIGALIDELHAGLQSLAQIDAPVLASLHGVVAGAGLSIACACDLAVAADGTKFQLAYTGIGASCDGSSTWSLPRLVGLRRALELALLNDTFDAPRALELGLVNRVVAAARLDDETLALATRLAQGPTRAFGEIRRLMRTSFETPLPAQLDREREAFLACSRTADFRQGVQAFVAKRPPKFSGR